MHALPIRYGILAVLVLTIGFVAYSRNVHAYSLINLSTLIESNAVSSTTVDEIEVNASITTGTPVVESEEVSNDIGLKAYADSLVASDEAVEEVKFTEEMVEVRYKQKGRILALVPITFTVTATVTADGRVEIKYPWYSTFTIDNKEEVKTSAKVAVDNALRAKAVGSVKAEGDAMNPKFTASESAAVAAGLHKVLKAALQAQSSLSTENGQ
ncbi:MAG: hypothetical protein NUV78_02900 [Candidatus Zambryskibacteria bacterium]|nr:hypothetical protein [Candidatus Zambryskibacteria bacterium]